MEVHQTLQFVNSMGVVLPIYGYCRTYEGEAGVNMWSYMDHIWPYS